MHDTIVIGAGLAGLMGALMLAEQGRSPLVLAKGQGSTHWTGGTIDLWGRAAEQRLRAALSDLIQQRPEHPYAYVGIAGIDAALARFCALVEAAHYPYVGGIERNVLLPTALGALRPTALMPVTMAAGDMRLGGEVLLAGFRELRDFFPALIAANLAAQGIAARGVYLQLPPIERQYDFNPRTFALLFDDAAFRAHIGQQLRIQRGEATRIGLPAVLGLREPLRVVAELQALSGAQIFEIPTLPPSVPGMRLFTIFRDAITAAGGRLQIDAEVLRSTATEQRLTTVYSAAAARQQAHRARAFLLATGGIAGGGVQTDHMGAVWETALGLPLQTPQTRDQWFAPTLLDERGHSIYRSGVRTDMWLRPLNPAGHVIYENVVVAGTALAQIDPVRDRCSSGLAITTGWKAAQLL